MLTPALLLEIPRIRLLEDPAMLGNPPLLIISLFALPLGIFVSVHLIIRSRENFVPERIPEANK